MSHEGGESEACIVCGSDFDSEDHQPVALPACGHTFCRQCVLRLDRTQRILRCPECRRPHEGEAPTNLPVNHQLLNYIVSRSQGDNKCVKTDGSCSTQGSGARRKHFPKKIGKGRKGDNDKSNSHASQKEDGDESDQGKSSCKKSLDSDYDNSDIDSGKGSGSEKESDDEDFRKRMDDEDLSSGKEDSDDSASPQRKKRDTSAKRREHDGEKECCDSDNEKECCDSDNEKECSDSDNDSPTDGSRTMRNDNTNSPLLPNNLVNIDFEIRQPQVIQPQRLCQYWTKKKLQIKFCLFAVLIVLICMGIIHLTSYEILDGIGFTSEGVRGNSHASSWQSQIQKSNSGKLKKNSLFSTLQRAAIKGFNAEWKSYITLGGLVVGISLWPFVFCCYKRVSKKNSVNEDHIQLATEENTIV
ncbi:uncharacterized protein LOC119590720 [Penaeus monodon]|uniref:uncharacterized protein LOC119590720 n=1 Tax=Penaeus monodon TaxID=6687 RepID=UPI0018A6D87C|nr:uncharacterized protein LOC119590720 [Penaeus monodon]